MSSWEAFRRGLDLDPSLTFLNTAATSPTHRATREAVRRFEDDRARRGEEGWDDWVRDVQTARNNTAKYFGAKVDEVAFLSNTGHGINTVAHTIPWRRGDEIIVNDLEFPSNLLPWRRLERQGVRVTIVPSRNGDLDEGDIVAAIGRNTRLVALSWVSYQSGRRFNVREIADAVHERDGLLFVDAIQGAGALRPEFGKNDVDFLACGAHKWMMAPFGVGALLVRDSLIEVFDPPFPGWQSRQDPDDFVIDNETWATTARRFETGNLNYGGIAGWNASVGTLAEVEDAPQRLHALASYCRKRARDSGFEVTSPEKPSQRAGITIVRVEDPARAKTALSSKNISVSVRGRGIRISTHLWNTEEEIDRCIETLAAHAQGNA